MARMTAIVPATDSPSTLPHCVRAIRAATPAPDELLVVASPAEAGPAAARNDGARRARGEILVFVDADVEVHADAFARIASAFDGEPGLAALFGSYDASPGAAGLVSTFRNLLHHHVHQTSSRSAETFWAGLGAVRREAFLACGGFDEARFPHASVEDVELGMRLFAAGRKIVLDPRLQGTHLKHWTLRQMIMTDFSRRGVPWTLLLLERRSLPGALNLAWRHRLSAAASLALVGGLAARRRSLCVGALAALVVLNGSFYAVLFRQGGLTTSAAGVLLHVVHHMTGVAAAAAGLTLHLRSRAASR